MGQKEMNGEVDYTAFRRVLAEVLPRGRVAEMKNYFSHSDVTVYRHCIRVAFAAYTFAVRHRIKCNLGALVRGALLHDYYLYDWHDKNKGFRWHGFKHHRFALANAERDFDLCDTERDIIGSHMFPLTFWRMPHCREAWLVTLADKKVAAEETLRKYRLCKERKKQEE